MTALQSDIEQRLAAAQLDVEVVLAEVLGGKTLRVFIDHPAGVSLGLCERVSLALTDLRDIYALEVSSPGAERPLTKPDHFRRHLGRRARIRTRGQRELIDQRGTRAARRSFTGELVGASETEVMLAAEEGVIAIPYAEIRRSNLVEE